MSAPDHAEQGHYAVPYLHTAADGKPALHGSRCGDCGQTYLGARMACARCGSRSEMSLVSFARHGSLYNYTVVHRSFPGVITPFVMAIVDLDDGPTVRGTLRGLQPDAGASEIMFGMPVEVIVEDSTQVDQDGRNLRTFHFIPSTIEDRT